MKYKKKKFLSFLFFFFLASSLYGHKCPPGQASYFILYTFLQPLWN